MAVWSVITTNEIELHRFDAEFYKPQYLEARHLAGEHKLRLYGVHVDHPAEVKRDYVENGLSAVLAQNNRDNYYDWSVRKYFPKSLLPVIRRNRLYDGDVTITRTGANYGQTSVVKNELAGNNLYACADLLILRSSPELGALISTYLNTEVGKSLMLRGAYGAAQPHIAPSYIYEIPMPQYLLSHAKEIDFYVTKSRNLQKEADSSWRQAQSLLESKLGLDKLNFDKPVSYAAHFSEVTLSQAISANRIDAQCFSPSALQYEQVLSALPSVQPLRFLTASMTKGAQQKESSKGTVPYASIKHIQNNEVQTDRKAKAFHRMPLARRGDLLLALTGSIGKVGIVSRYDELTISGDILSIRVSYIDPYYLLAVLANRIGQVQLLRWITGSNQGHLAPRDVGRVLVPRLDEKLEQRIASLMKESIDKTHESEHLLEQAKRRVEELIEEAIAA